MIAGRFISQNNVWPSNTSVHSRDVSRKAVLNTEWPPAPSRTGSTQPEISTLWARFVGIRLKYVARSMSLRAVAGATLEGELEIRESATIRMCFAVIAFR